MKFQYNPRYPAVEDLIKKAKKRIPRFAFEYLDGGCNEEINLYKNTAEIREIELHPQYLKNHEGSDMKTELFGHVYDAPFGIAPVGFAANNCTVLRRTDLGVPSVLSCSDLAASRMLTFA